MKKQLLSTSALVAAGMIATAGAPSIAQAQQTAQAPASSPIQVQVGGYMRQSIGWSDGDDTGAGSGVLTSTAKHQAVSVASDTEIYFQGKTTLANGISVSMRVELEGNTSNDMIDESFVTVSGAFGQIYLGSTDSVAQKLLITAPGGNIGPQMSVGGNLGIWGIDPERNTGSTSLMYGANGAIQMNDDDSEKISYITPRFAGFQAGVSYTPEVTQDRVGAGHARTNSRDSYIKGMAAGLNFTQAFGAVDVAAGAGYYKMTAPNLDGSNITGVATLPDPEAYAIGGQIGFAGFRFGAAYGRVKDKMAITPIAAGGNGALTTADNWNHGSTWEAGLTYTFGPAVVGVGYVTGKAKASTAIAGDEKTEAYGLTGRYTLGPGVDLQAGLFYTNAKGEGRTLINGQDTDNNKVTTIATGIALAF